MTQLEKLQAARNLTDLAKLLGYKPAGLSYILYKLTDEQKYHSFDIPKRSGEMRRINAPIEELALLQGRLKELLSDCVEKEICQENKGYWQASHSFRKKRTIVSNASMHCRKRYVFNVDIEDFFGSINFDRVRGFFLKDKNFKLQEPVATIITQYGYENTLPQGSPCSPIISNLLGNILDSRLLGLAKKTRCTYTRYADDLTFSTNLKDFPIDIAKRESDGSWEAGGLLN